MYFDVSRHESCKGRGFGYEGEDGGYVIVIVFDNDGIET